MILHGNQRGGGKDLALHLMKDENERVQVHELRGFVADTLIGAFTESYAISKATRCKQHLYSLSISPPKDTDLADDAFVDAIEQTEKKLGLTGQPRAVVFHEKLGEDGQLRRHAHAVWCRIDIEQMKAVQLSHSKLKLRDVSRDLHIQHDLKMPKGLINSKDRDPRNFTLEEWQQCKRAKKNVHQIKDVFKDCWAVSDSRTSFAHALAEQGYILAKGDRGHVAVDYKGEKFAVSRYVGVKARQVRDKLGEADELPDVDHAQKIAAKQVTERREVLQRQQQAQAQHKAQAAQREAERMKEWQARAAKKLKQDQDKQRAEQDKAQQQRLRKGLLGLMDRVTGKRKRTLLQNEMEKAVTHQRDQGESQTLDQLQRQAFAEQRKRANSAQRPFKEAVKELETDIREVSKPPAPSKDRDKAGYTAKEKFKAARNPRPRRSRSRNRDGPEPGL